MIDRNMFFIWIGDNKPSYVDWTVQKYREVNPTFKVKLEEVKDPYSNEEFLEMAKIIRGEFVEEPYTSIFKDYVYHFTHDNKWLIDKMIRPRKSALLAELFRYYLIYKYGGIYIDADSFPVKPFDDELFSLLNDKYKYITPYKDVFFICAEKGYASLSFNISPFHKYIPNPNVHKTEKYEEYKKKFVNCELKYGDSLFSTRREDYSKYDWPYFKYIYFDHYFVRTWKKETDKEADLRNEFYNYLGL